MEKIKVIKSKYLPVRYPIVGTVCYITALDYWNAPQWAWGVVCALIALVWILIVIRKLSEEEIDPLTVDSETKSSFAQKLKERLEK